MATIPIPSHIVLDDRGVAWIEGANTKVIEVASEIIAYGRSPEEIHFQHPHLSLAQIHAALAHFYDHEEEFRREITRCEGRVRELRASSPEPLSRAELEARVAARGHESE